MSRNYGSGLEYQGFAATGTVNLFDNPSATTPKLQLKGVELAGLLAFARHLRRRIRQR